MIRLSPILIYKICALIYFLVTRPPLEDTNSTDLAVSELAVYVTIPVVACCIIGIIVFLVIRRRKGMNTR